ncbi:MAG: methyltransferase domain-containing protein [Gemmatimonadaceae bacterium]
MTHAGVQYIHGYHERESDRLRAQAWSVEDHLHLDTRYASGSLVLEAGCGTGAQTVTLARNNPRTRIVAVDRSRVSLDEARARVEGAKLSNVEFHQADLFDLPFAYRSFDHVFLCFVLEHLPNPRHALARLRKLLKSGGTLTTFEGDHGSVLFHPESDSARRAVACQVELQRRSGGDANIGRRLYPLLRAAGYIDVRVTPCPVYVDGSRPKLIDAFTRQTFTGMVADVRERAIAAAMIDSDDFDRGVRDLDRVASDGVFCYTFFKGKAVCPRGR